MVRRVHTHAHAHTRLPYAPLVFVRAQHKKNSKNGRITDQTKADMEAALRANQLRNKRIQARREADTALGIYVHFDEEDVARAREKAEREADRAGELGTFEWGVSLEHDL